MTEEIQAQINGMDETDVCGNYWKWHGGIMDIRNDG
jgi:hypothetical protein